MFLCPECHKETRVMDSRWSKNEAIRRRQCLGCGHRFSTTEAVGTRIATARAIQQQMESQMQAFDDLTKRIQRTIKDFALIAREDGR